MPMSTTTFWTDKTLILHKGLMRDLVQMPCIREWGGGISHTPPMITRVEVDKTDTDADISSCFIYSRGPGYNQINGGKGEC